MRISLHLLLALSFSSCLLIQKLNHKNYLNLTSKGLEKLEKRGFYKNDLQTLYLNTNNLETLPDSIFELTNLEILSLTNNKLIEISPKIGRLTQLKELSLMGNNLSTLPKEISNLVVLERLLLLGNKFMPEELERIHRLLPCTDLFIYLDSELNDYYNYPPCNKF